MNRTTKPWAKQKPTPFAVADATNGFGHRLVQLSLSYMCNVIPNQRQLLVQWLSPTHEDTNRMWHALFEDTPVLAGLPKHWKMRMEFEKAAAYRKSTGAKTKIYKEGMSRGDDMSAGDYHMNYNTHSAGKHCQHWGHTRDLGLLRLAKEPSVQEFYHLLRAQLRQKTKDKMAEFIETFFPNDKIVVGVHIRSGNGKDNGSMHFDQVQRGDWLKDLPAAIRMVRKHLRMVAYSLINRYNAGLLSGLDFNKDEFDEEMDGCFRISLATDSGNVVEEFRRQHPNVLTLEQERMAPGEGVAIHQPAKCYDKDTQIALISNSPLKRRCSWMPTFSVPVMQLVLEVYVLNSGFHHDGRRTCVLRK